MFFISEWYILPAAFVLDLIFGDPRFLPHPVRWMGKGIEVLEPRFRNFSSGLFTGGLAFSLTLILLAWATSTIVMGLSFAIHPVPGKIIEIGLIYYCISTLSLKKAALDVVRSLREEGLATAKKRLCFIVGRDVEPLDEEGVARATLETVAENLVDGVVAPLFWAGIGGAPFAVVYKMINTLDSMVGYKNETYLEFGKASAKIDDIANFIPARLSVPIIASASYLLLGHFKAVLHTAVSDGRNHSSPNAGFPEASFAGALGVRLGGPNYYGGECVQKPYIGSSFGPVAIGDVEKACRLMVYSSAISIFMAMTLAHVVSMV